MAADSLNGHAPNFQLFVGPPQANGSAAQKRLGEAKAEAEIAEQEARAARAKRLKADEELAGAANVREWLRNGVTGFGSLTGKPQPQKHLPVQLIESTAVNAPELDWARAYADYLDIFRSDGFWPVFGSIIDRKYGMNWPFFRTDQELTLLRSISRIVAGLNPHAAGFVGGGCAYVIGKGMTPKAIPKDTETNGEERKADRMLCDMVMEEIEEFSGRVLFPQLQQEIFNQSLIDGEYFLRLFDLGDELDVRGIWPELIRMPPGASLEEYSFGVKTPPEDLWRVQAYHECDYSLGYGEEIPATEMEHFPLFVPGKYTRGIKRGMPVFSHGVQDAFDTAGKLLRNMGEGTAIRQSFAFFRQWDAVDRESASDFVQTQEDYRTRKPFATALTESVTKAVPGRVIDAPAGMKFAELPQSTETQAAVEVVDALLRNAVAILNAPEWLCTGNARNMGAYTSSMVAESPFVKRMEQMQEYYANKFLKILKLVIRIAVRARRLPEECITRVKLSLEHPSLIARDKAAEANVNQTYVGMKVKSRQQVAQELNLDYEKQRREIQEEAEEDIQDQQKLQQMMPQQPPGAPPGGGQPPPGGGGDQGPPPEQMPPAGQQQGGAGGPQGTEYNGPRGGHGVKDPTTGRVRYGVEAGNQISRGKPTLGTGAPSPFAGMFESVDFMEDTTDRDPVMAELAPKPVGTAVEVPLPAQPKSDPNKASKAVTSTAPPGAPLKPSTGMIGPVRAEKKRAIPEPEPKIAGPPKGANSKPVPLGQPPGTEPPPEQQVSPILQQIQDQQQQQPQPAQQPQPTAPTATGITQPEDGTAGQVPVEQPLRQPLPPGQMHTKESFAQLRPEEQFEAVAMGQAPLTHKGADSVARAINAMGQEKAIAFGNRLIKFLGLNPQKLQQKFNTNINRKLQEIAGKRALGEQAAAADEQRRAKEAEADRQQKAKAAELQKTADWTSKLGKHSGVIESRLMEAAEDDGFNVTMADDSQPPGARLNEPGPRPLPINKPSSPVPLKKPAPVPAKEPSVVAQTMPKPPKLPETITWPRPKVPVTEMATDNLRRPSQDEQLKAVDSFVGRVRGLDPHSSDLAAQVGSVYDKHPIREMGPGAEGLAARDLGMEKFNSPNDIAEHLRDQAIRSMGAQNQPEMSQGTPENDRPLVKRELPAGVFPPPSPTIPEMGAQGRMDGIMARAQEQGQQRAAQGALWFDKLGIDGWDQAALMDELMSSKDEHIAGLARTVQKDPNKIGPLMVLADRLEEEGKPEASAYFRKAAQIVPLAVGQIKGMERLEHKGLNPVYLAAMEHDGHRQQAIFKPAVTGVGRNLTEEQRIQKWGTGDPELRQTVDIRDQHRNEVAAYRIAQAVGLHSMVPATVDRKFGTTEGSMQEYIGDGISGALAVKPWGNNEEALKMAAAFDFLIGNTDRHFGNWLVAGNGLKLIDHGLSFPRAPGDFGNRNNKFMERMIGHGDAEAFPRDVQLYMGRDREDPESWDYRPEKSVAIPKEVAEWAKMADEFGRRLQDTGLSRDAIIGVKARAKWIGQAALKGETFADLMNRYYRTAHPHDMWEAAHLDWMGEID